jgi:hypothetical protein
MAKRGATPKWTDVKAALAGFDRMGLLGLVQDLYAANKDNQAFLHARFALGEDPLKPYKETLKRWLSPDWRGNGDVSVSKAKQAITSYKNAVGDPFGLTELLVYGCECAAGFSAEFGYADEPFFNILLAMFEESLQVSRQLPESHREVVLDRLHGVWEISEFGYGVSEAMEALLAADEAEHPGKE